MDKSRGGGTYWTKNVKNGAVRDEELRKTTGLNVVKEGLQRTGGTEDHTGIEMVDVVSLLKVAAEKRRHAASTD